MFKHTLSSFTDPVNLKQDLENKKEVKVDMIFILDMTGSLA